MMEQPNLSYIKELAGGDAAFEKKLILVLKKELPNEITEYQRNMKDCAFAKAAENVHKIKHKLGIVGLNKGYEWAIAYENELKNQKNASQGRFDEMLQVLSHFVNDL